MKFDLESKTIQLCAKGMELEGLGKREEAAAIFNEAWDNAQNDSERFTAAHYIARHQNTVSDKLKWDEISLQLAISINDENAKGAFPSLYLNIAKCYEDLNDQGNALKNYELAHAASNILPDDGYGNLIRNGIKNGIERIKKI